MTTEHRTTAAAVDSCARTWALAYRGEARAVDLAADGASRARTRADRGRAGRRQDDARAGARPEPLARLPAHPVHERHAAGRRHRDLGLPRAGSDRFEFHPGPIFANIVLADEINRATPKTQSALLEAMNEGAVTVESERRPLPQPFMVVATQNPVEYLGHVPAARVADGPLLPAPVARLPGRGGGEDAPAPRRHGARARRDSGGARRPRRSSRSRTRPRPSTVSERLLDYLHALVRATRQTRPSCACPVSTRGAQALFRAVQAHALLAGTRLRDAGRRPGGRRGGPRAPHPLGLLRRLRGRGPGAGDRAEDPGAGAGAGLKPTAVS